MLTSAQSQWLRTLGAIAGGSGKADAGAATADLPRPMAADCKILRGRVPGPAHHVLCQTHGHVLDVTAKTIIASSIEDYSKRFPKPSDKAVAQSAQPAAVQPRQPAATPSPTPQEMVAIANADLEAAAAVERKRLIARVEIAKSHTFAAFDDYQEQKRIGEDQFIISGLSRAAKEVTTLGDFEDPGPELKRILEELRSSARSAITALNVNDLATADGICTKLDALAARAEKLARGYSEGLIDGAETAKTTVKVVDTGAKVVGGVALTVATGGAAAGVIAAEVGTATAISVAGGVAASTAGVATKLALGEKVDWGMFSIDILMQGLGARFSAKLTEGIAAAVAQRLGPAAATIGGALIKNAAAQVVMHVDSTLFKTALETGYRKLNGSDLTLQQVYDSCIEQLTDPSSLVVLAATSAAQGHVDAKAAAASATPTAKAGDSLPSPPSVDDPGKSTMQPAEQAIHEPGANVQRTNAELIGSASSALAKLKAAKASPEGISTHDLNAAEAALRAMRQRQQSTPDAALQTALEAATTDYSDTIHTPVSLQGAGPSAASGHDSAAKARKVAVDSGLENLAEGRAGFQTHNTSGETRKVVGTSGDTHQSAHLVPQAVDRAIGASAGKALTANLPKKVHRRIDGDWVPKWKGAVARGEQITGADVQRWVGEAVQKVPNTMLPPEPGAAPGTQTHPLKNTLEWRLGMELQELGIGPGTVIVPAKS